MLSDRNDADAIGGHVRVKLAGSGTGIQDADTETETTQHEN